MRDILEMIASLGITAIIVRLVFYMFYDKSEDKWINEDE
jgi:hypothetical protein